MKRPMVICGMLACLVLLYVIWMREDATLDVPQSMMMTSAQLAETPDFALAHMAFSEVRVKVEANPANYPHWRTLPDAARHLLVLSWIEERFTGFPAVFRRQRSGVYKAQVDDFVAAYQAVGASGVADIVRDAGRTTSELPPGSDAEQRKACADLEAQYMAQRNKANISNLIRVYIRSHAEEIAQARVVRD